MSEVKDVPMETRHVVNVVGPKLAHTLGEYRLRLSAPIAGFQVLTDWHPAIPDGWGEFPQVPFQRSVVYRGNEETWAYSHHHTLAKWGDKYVVSWSNGFLHEDYVGQEVHCAWSDDGLNWSEPSVVVHTPVESQKVRNNAGLYAADGRVYCYVGVANDFGRGVTAPGMTSLLDQHIHVDVYETTDLEHWTHHENICDNNYLFEGPRMTRGGRLLCCGYDMLNNDGMVMIWDDASKPAARPRVVRLKPKDGWMMPEQGTWYQTDDGRIWAYQRDQAISCRLGLCWSDDEGDTWSDLYRTDFPNTFSRAFAGRLSDGRYYIAGNNYDVFLDRLHLLIALSDDGRVFDRQYTLVEGRTTRRVNGRHKEDGYHYPNCLVDGDKLLVTYSVNKEDIEVGIADMTQVD